MSDPEIIYTNKTKQESTVDLKVTHVVYGLQLVGLFTFVGFIFGIILNYIKVSDVRGTWLESHFRWQIRTFWFGILWSIIGGLLVMFLVGYAILCISYIWMIYRVIKGWMYLIDHREIY